MNRYLTACRAGIWTSYIIALVIGCSSCNRGPTEGRIVQLRECWFEHQPSPGAARPAILGQGVVFATETGMLIARESVDGEVLWTQKITGSPIRGRSMAVGRETLVVSALYETAAVNATNGAIRWLYNAPLDSLALDPPMPGYVAANAVAADETHAYIPAWGPSVSAVDLQTGSIRWVWNPKMANRAGASGVQVSGDTVFVLGWQYVNPLGGQSEPLVLALDRRTGAELWRVAVPAIGSGVVVQGAPILRGELLFFAGLHGYLAALDRKNGSVVWDFRSPTSYTASVSQPEMYGDIVYHYGGDARIYALAAQTGAVLWKTPIEGMVLGDLLVTERYLYASNGIVLFVYDRTTGRLIARQPMVHTAEGIYKTPAASIDGKRIFVGSTAGAQCFEAP